VASPPASVEEIAKRIVEEAGARRAYAKDNYTFAFSLADYIEPLIAAALLSDRSAMREEVAAWMIRHSFATGHGDTLADLLGELSGQVRKMQEDRAPSAASRRLLADAVVSRDGRIKELERDLAKAKADAREMAMQAISDLGQYQENFERAEASEAEAARLREALEKIAAFDDSAANTHLRVTGSYAGFDDPASVAIARAALPRPDEPTKET